MLTNTQQPLQEIPQRRAFNVSSSPVRLEIAVQVGYAPTAHIVPPGECVTLPASYTTPMLFAPGRDPRPSVIDMKTNGKVVDEADPRAKEVVAKYDAAKAAVTAELAKKGGR